MRKPRSIAWLLAILMVAGVCLPLMGSASVPPITHNIAPPVGGPPNDPDTPTKKGLFLAVDKTQAVVGDTLTFKVTWNGGGRGKSIVL